MNLETPVEQMEKKGLASMVAAYEALSSARAGGEFSWLDDMKDEAFRHWKAEGLPTRRLERWKYTSLEALNGAVVELPDKREIGEITNPFATARFTAEIVFVDGVFHPAASRLPAVEGIRYAFLSELIDRSRKGGLASDQHELVVTMRGFFEKGETHSRSVFASLNTSFLQDALLLQVDAGKTFKDPILVRHVTGGAAKRESGFSVSSPRVLISVGRSSEFAIVEAFNSESEARWFVNSVTDILLGDAARVSYCRVQLENEDSLHIGTTRIHHSRNSYSESAQFTFGARLSREDLLIRLDAEGAEAKLSGFYFARGQQHVDNYTLVDHEVPYTTSDQIYKGILDGESRAVFNGHVRIHRNAQKSHAAQVNKNLMLSRKAEVDTRPELEIDADDVKASHGATIGQLDPEHVYYLQSRAIPKHEAVKMLARGFAQEIAFGLQNEAIRAFMSGIVAERLNGMEVGHE